MIKIKRKIGVALCSFLFATCCVGSVALLHKEKATAAMSYTDVYTKHENISLNSFEKDGISGISFSPYRKNAKTSLLKETVGDFSFEFDTNDTIGIFSLVFTNGEKSFSVVVNAKRAAIDTSVRIGDENFGRYYYNGSCVGLTADKNANGEHTKTAFGVKNTVRFAPSTMEIFISDGTEYVVWDLSKTINDGAVSDFRYTAFDSYSVDLVFETKDFTVNCYSVNDVSQERVMIDFTGPNLYVKPARTMKLGEKYYFPNAYASDFIDGKTSDIAVEVLFKGSSLLQEKFEYGKSFTPTKLGNYELVYTATDRSGNVTKESVYVSCAEQISDGEWTFDYDMPATEYGVGSSVLLPFASYSSADYSAEMFGKAFLKCGDSILTEVCSFDGTENAIVFDKAGEYELVYTLDDLNFTDVYSQTIVVSGETASISSFAYGDRILGETFSFQSVTSAGDGTQKNVLQKLTYPSGKTSDTDCILDEVGEYRVVYMVDGANYAATFAVRRTLTSDGSKSSAVSGRSPYTDENGLNVLLQSNDTLYFNQTIDLKNSTKDDTLIEFYMTPSEKGTNEITQLQLYIVDKYDSTNYLTIDISQVFDNYVTYTKAAASNGQVLSGWENYGQSNANWHSNGAVWGTFGMTSLAAATTVAQPTEYTFKYAYDYETKTLYSQIVPGVVTVVAKFDDDACFSQPWDGFTTGEVILGIKGYNFSKSSATMFVREIYGIGLTSDYEIDSVGPIIEIDYSEYQVSNLPKGVVNVPYRILSATAQDAASGVKSLEVFVKSITDDKAYNVENSCFIPDKAGKYVVSYVAYDYFNNRTVEEFVVEVDDSMERISVSAEPVTNIFVGEEYKVATATYRGGSGKLNCSLQVKLNGKYCEIQDGYFFDKTGVYEAKYSVTDYLGATGEYAFEIIVAYSDLPVFTVHEKYPDVFVSGATYSVCEVGAKYYSDGENGTDCEVKVFLQDKNGEKEITEDFFVPEVDKNGDTVTIRYEASYGNRKNVLSYEIKTVKVKYTSGFSLKNYVAANNVNATYVEGEGLVFSGKSDGSAIWTKNIVADGFKLEFDVDKTKNNIGKISIILFDSEDESQSVKLTIFNTGETTSKMSINDGRAYEVKGSFTENTAYKFTVSYDNVFRVIKDADKYKQTIADTMYGKEFCGFTSGKVRFKLLFEEVEGSFGLTLKTIGNQSFVSIKTDRVQPMAALVGAYAKFSEKDTLIDLLDIVSEDVLDPQTSVSLSVLCNGENVKSTDGVVLNKVPLANGKAPYSLKLSSYGTYLIEYLVTDGGGNRYSLSQQILVLSEEKPTIEIDGNISENASVGESKTLPYATAKDYTGKSLDVMIIVTLPSGKRCGVGVGEDFVFENKGIYTLKYYALDDSGNYAETIFTVTVS